MFSGDIMTRVTSACKSTYVFNIKKSIFWVGIRLTMFRWSEKRPDQQTSNVDSKYEKNNYSSA